MAPDALLIFRNSMPFEPFTVQVSDRREIFIRHPEFALVGKYGMTLWLFNEHNGAIEAIDAAHIVALRTLGPVDPAIFLGESQNE
jgi:hypothetical protein